MIASLACANHELRADLSPVEPVLRPRRVLVEGVEHLIAPSALEAQKPFLAWAGLRRLVARVIVVVIVAVAEVVAVVARVVVVVITLSPTHACLLHEHELGLLRHGT